jgi:hypothetical protein
MEREKGNTEVQSVLFDRDKFTIEQAKDWLSRNGFKSDKVHETDKKYRFRQSSPDFCNGKYRTKEITDGVQFVFGIK